MLIAPAMHSHMGVNPAVRENLEKLRAWGVGVVPGASAEGEDKVAGPEEVAAAVLHRLAHGPWVGRRVVVIGGASRESIDSVRSVTNESSGATAIALANQAYYRGADVLLWAGALQVPVPPWVSLDRWRGVDDLLALVRQRRSDLSGSAAVIVPAALSDYTLERSPGKIPSREHATLTLTLRRAPKILPELRHLAPRPTLLVAFKLEAGLSPADLEQEARRLVAETQADWVVANDVTSLGSGETTALILPPSGDRRWIRGPKAEFAGKLLDDIGQEIANLDASRPPSAPGPGPVRHRASGRRSARARRGA